MDSGDGDGAGDPVDGSGTTGADSTGAGPVAKAAGGRADLRSQPKRVMRHPASPAECTGRMAPGAVTNPPPYLGNRRVLSPRFGRLRVRRRRGVEHWQVLPDRPLQQDARHHDGGSPHEEALQLSRPRVAAADW